MGDEERLAALERRVERLERAVGAPADTGGADDTGTADGTGTAGETAAGTAAAGTTSAAPRLDPEQFWALTGLRHRAPDPAGAVLFTGTVRVPGGGTYEWQETRAAGDLLDGDWAGAGTALTALAHPVRLLLLREILHGTRTSAADLATLESVGTSGQVYHHLRQLTGAGWLRTAARGRYVVPPERVVPLLTIIAAAGR